MAALANMETQTLPSVLTNVGQYVVQLSKRIPTAVVIPFRPGEIGDWKAAEHQCHSNAAYWCKENPGDTLVPGWLYFSFNGLLPYVRFTAHTVVRLNSGELRDITPSRASMPYPFIEALESPAEYDELVEKHRVMHLDLYLEEGRVEAIGVRGNHVG